MRCPCARALIAFGTLAGACSFNAAGVAVSSNADAAAGDAQVDAPPDAAEGCSDIFANISVDGVAWCT